MEIFVLFRSWWVEGGWCPTFCFFEFSNNTIVYTLGTDGHTCIWISVQANYIIDFISFRSWLLYLWKQKSKNVGRFLVFRIKLYFCHAECCFWYLFNQFIFFFFKLHKKKEKNEKEKVQIKKEERKEKKEKRKIKKEKKRKSNLRRKKMKKIQM